MRWYWRAIIACLTVTMLRKTLTILSLIGLLLSVAAWGVSGNGGLSYTYFYAGQSGQELGIALICADGKIGWDEPDDVSDSVLSADHGVSLWLPTLVFAGSILFSLLPLRGLTLNTLSIIGVLLSMGLWGVSYYGVGITGSTDVIVAAYYGSVYVSQWSSGRLTGLVAEDKWEILYLDGSTEIRSPMTPIGEWYYQKSDWLPDWTSSAPQPVGIPFDPSSKNTIVSVPLYLTSLMFVLLPGYSSGYLIYRRRKRRKLGLCLKCGYDLRASKDRCPECGRTL